MYRFQALSKIIEIQREKTMDDIGKLVVEMANSALEAERQQVTVDWKSMFIKLVNTLAEASNNEKTNGEISNED